MITGRNKRALEDHVDREPFLEQTLAAKGEHAKLAAVQTSSSLADLHYQSRPRQLTPRGPTGHGANCLVRCATHRQLKTLG